MVNGKYKRKSVYRRTQAEVWEKLEAIKRDLALGKYNGRNESVNDDLDRCQVPSHNPVEGVSALTETPREMVLWTREQAQQFLTAIKDDCLYSLFYLALTMA